MSAVDRRIVRVEACLRRYVDLAIMKILVKVGSKQCENHCHRKGKGSLTMSISQGLVDPNSHPNWIKRKGKQVKIPVLIGYVR